MRCPRCQSADLEQLPVAEGGADWFLDVYACGLCGHRWAVN